MQFAKERRSGKELSATKAVASRDYVCPACGEDVYVRGGVVRIRHFAHRSGRADPDCENYYPASTIAGPVAPTPETAGLPEQQNVRIEPLKLALRLEPRDLGSSRASPLARKWRLALLLPKAQTQVGRIRIPTGFGIQSRDLPLNVLFAGPREVDVSPNATRFGVEWTSDEVDRIYRSAISGWIDGLAGTVGTAFGAIGSRFKLIANSFVWGDSYYVIWRQPNLVIPNALIPQLMSTYEGWHAALITLPDSEDGELADWLEQTFKLRVQSLKRRWGIIYPPPLGADLDGRIQLLEDGDIFATTISSGNQETSSLSIGSKGQVIQLPTKAAGADVIRIVRDESESTAPLYLKWGTRDLQPILSVPVQAAQMIQPVALVSVSENGQSANLCFHHREAREALNRVRQNKAELRAILLPSGMRGALDLIDDGGSWQKVLTLVAEESKENSQGVSPIGSKQLQEIVTLLGNNRLGVRLSFGAFGEYSSLGVTSVNRQARLAADVRRRLLWYCLACNVNRGVSRAGKSLSDQELLTLFDVVEPRPHLVAHRNVLRALLRSGRVARTPT